MSFGRDNRGPPRDSRSGPRGDDRRGPPRDAGSGRQGDARRGPPRDSRPGRQGDERRGPPRDFRPNRQGDDRRGPPRDFRPDRQGDDRRGPPRDFRPNRQGDDRRGPPRDFRPNRQGDDRRGPPRDFRPDPRRDDSRRRSDARGTTGEDSTPHRPPLRHVPKSDQVQCAHWPACVGCPGMGRSYTKQLNAKHEKLLRIFAEHPELEGVQVLSPVGSPRATGYRNHAKLVFRQRRNRETLEDEVILGVYKPGTHSVMPADSCIVHHRRLQPLLRVLREEVEELQIPIYDERTGEGCLRYALARTSDLASRTHLTLVSAKEKIPKLNTLVLRMQRKFKELESVFLCVNAEGGNQLLTDDIRQIKGPPALREKFGELTLESRAGAFLQANTEVASRIYDTAARWLDAWAAEGVIDLYCGVGAIGLAAAGRNTRLLGIESSESSIECAKANAKRMQRHGAEFVAAPAEEVCEIAAKAGFEKPAALIVNPPRRGLSQEAGEAILKLAPRRILYVSCDPETLARDLAAFVREGWVARRARMFDMLPQTPHIETMVLLERRAT